MFGQWKENNNKEMLLKQKNYIVVMWDMLSYSASLVEVYQLFSGMRMLWTGKTWCNGLVNKAGIIDIYVE